MNPMLLLITIHSTLVLLATAQLEPQPEESQNQNPIHPSIPVVLGILSVMFSVTFLLCAYAKFCHGPARHSDSFRNHDQGLGGLIRSRSRFSGIDKVAIESLPFFRFSSLKGSKEGLECAVCISRFEDSEVLRLLPKCRHAFHMACIDQWLERHSSCPLCRYKLDAREIRSLTYSNSLRYVGDGNSTSNNPANDLNYLDIFVQREEESAKEASSSSSFISRSFRGKREETMLADQESDIRPLHKVKHKIVVSDVVIKSRWSDVNSSDLLLLNSEMLSEASSKRFSNSERGNTNGRFSVEKVKEDMERKRVIESRLGRSHSDPNSNVGEQWCSTRPLSGEERRSMSEITNVSRFSARNGVNGEEERTRRLWLVIARRTVRWFAGRHTDSSNV